MSQQEDNESISIEELVMSQMYAIQAIINVLERKGVLTREEVFDEIEAIEEAAGECECDCGCHCEGDCDCEGEHTK